MVCVCVCVHTLFICVGVHAYGYSCMARGTCWVLSPSTSHLILWDKVSYWTLSSLNWLAHPEDLPISLPGTGVIGTLLGTTFYTSVGDRTKSSWLRAVQFTNGDIVPVPRRPYIDLLANFEATLSLFILSSPSIPPAHFFFGFFQYQIMVELRKEK